MSYVPTYNFEPSLFEEDVTPVTITIPQWEQKKQEIRDSASAIAKNWPRMNYTTLTKIGK